MNNTLEDHLTNNYVENFHSILNRKFQKKPRANEFLKKLVLLIEKQVYKY